MLGYSNKITINGFEIEFGRMTMAGKLGVFLNFENESIQNAMSEANPLLLEAIKNILLMRDELDALNTFSNFEYSYLQGHSWSTLPDFYSFEGLVEFFKQAELVLQSEHANDKQRESAHKLINTLNGTPPLTPPRELSALEKKQREFQKKRNKLFKLLIERDGYSCSLCNVASDLCVSHLISLKHGGTSDMDNLKLKCKKCLNKREHV